MKQKLLVKALAPIMLIDPTTHDYVDNKRPYVVHNTYLMKQRSGGTIPPMKAQIQIYDVDLKDDATDEELAKYFRDSDNKEDLAVSAFLSKWGADTKDEDPDSGETDAGRAEREREEEAERHRQEQAVKDAQAEADRKAEEERVEKELKEQAEKDAQAEADRKAAEEAEKAEKDRVAQAEADAAAAQEQAAKDAQQAPQGDTSKNARKRV